MADRIRHIKGRNLVVCETFDDFAAAVENTDFTVEDVVGYVVSLTNVYYWLNVESVWGAIGFTWDVNEEMTPEESAQYLNVWKRMEHVLSTGYNVDKKNPEDPDEEIPNDRPDGPMPGEEGYEYSEANKFDIAQKRRLSPITKGYGHFNRTTIPFTHIPTLPDGYRITAITGSTLANINIIDGVLYIDKSDWRNLNVIDNLLSRTMTLYADLDNSDITSATAITNSGSGSLYLKANLNNIPNQTVLSNRCLGRLVANDYYKDLNIRLGKDSNFFIYLNSKSSYNSYSDRGNYPTLCWEGTGPFKLEYFFTFDDYNSVYSPPYYAHSGNPNATRAVRRVSSENGEFYFMNYTNYDDSVNNGVYFAFAPYGNGNLYDLTIDCTNGISDVRLDYDLANRGEEQHGFKMLPIKYLGNVTSIGTYNPSLRVGDDQWPEFRQDLVDKLNHNLGDYIFHNITIVNATHKCPYTIDCRNLDYIRIFVHMRLTVSNYQDYDPDTGNGKAIDIYPNIIVDSNKIYKEFNLAVFDRGSARYVKIPDVNIKAVRIPTNSYVSLYIGKNTHITTSYMNFSSGFNVYDGSIPSITLKKLSDTTALYFATSADPSGIGISSYYNLSTGHINYVEIDATKEELMEGTIATTVKNKSNAIVDHPFIVCNKNINNSYGQGDPHYTNFMLIYRSSITAPISNSNYTNDELMQFAECFEETGNDTVYNIYIKAALCERLRGLYKDGVNLEDYITSKGYVINDV